MPIIRRNGTVPILIVGPPLFVIGFKTMKDVSVSNDYYTYSSSVSDDTRIVLLEFSKETKRLNFYPNPIDQYDRIVRVSVNEDLPLPNQFTLLLSFLEEQILVTKGDVIDDWY